MFKVLLVDDQKLIREGIRSLLAISGKVQVVAEAADGSSVVAQCQAVLAWPGEPGGLPTVFPDYWPHLLHKSYITC
ncbi:hypothetical protein ALON55S_01957 [Alishewanella longhuensis]